MVVVVTTPQPTPPVQDRPTSRLPSRRPQYREGVGAGSGGGVSCSVLISGLAGQGIILRRRKNVPSRLGPTATFHPRQRPLSFLWFPHSSFPSSSHFFPSPRIYPSPFSSLFSTFFLPFRLHFVFHPRHCLLRSLILPPSLLFLPPCRPPSSIPFSFPSFFSISSPYHFFFPSSSFSLLFLLPSLVLLALPIILPFLISLLLPHLPLAPSRLAIAHTARQGAKIQVVEERFTCRSPDSSSRLVLVAKVYFSYFMTMLIFFMLIFFSE